MNKIRCRTSWNPLLNHLGFARWAFQCLLMHFSSAFQVSASEWLETMLKNLAYTELEFVSAERATQKTFRTRSLMSRENLQLDKAQQAPTINMKNSSQREHHWGWSFSEIKAVFSHCFKWHQLRGSESQNFPLYFNQQDTLKWAFKLSWNESTEKFSCYSELPRHLSFKHHSLPGAWQSSFQSPWLIEKLSAPCMHWKADWDDLTYLQPISLFFFLPGRRIVYEIMFSIAVAGRILIRRVVWPLEKDDAGAKVLIALAIFPIHKCSGERMIQARVMCKCAVLCRAVVHSGV